MSGANENHAGVVNSGPNDDDATLLKRRMNTREKDSSPLSAPMINSPLLSYVHASLQTGTKEQIRRVVLGHFDPKLVTDAKNDLWASYADVLGEKKTRKGSNSKSKYEFEMDDIFDAMDKLDALKIEPNFVVSATDLFLLPRTRPEEVLSISIIERLSTLECQMQRIIEEYVVDPCRSEIFSTLKDIAHDNIALKKRIDALEMPPPSGARVPDQRIPQIHRPLKVHQQSQQLLVQQPQQPQQSQQPQQPQQLTPPSSQQLQMQQPQQEQQVPPPTQSSSPPPSQMQQPQLQQLNMPSHLPPESSIRASRESLHSLASWPSMSTTSQGFKLPAKQVRRNRRRAMRNCGTRPTLEDSHLKGAPVPMRDLFIYRVMKPSTCNDIITYIKGLKLNVEVADIELVAHPEAKYNSFRVSCNITSFKRLLNGEIWPDGVCVDRFRSKNNGQKQ